jgi:hypothetical protein
MLDSRDKTFPVLMTHQSMKNPCTSINFLKKVTLELLGKRCFLSRFEVEEIQLHLINSVQERDVISRIVQEALMML